jgi:hypothetical protein
MRTKKIPSNFTRSLFPLINCNTKKIYYLLTFQAKKILFLDRDVTIFWVLFIFVCYSNLRFHNKCNQL